MAWSLDSKAPSMLLHIFGVAVPCYAALSALALNLGVAIVLSVIFNALSRGRRADETVAAITLTERAQPKRPVIYCSVFCCRARLKIFSVAHIRPARPDT